MPSIQVPCTNPHHSSTTACALERRDTAETLLPAEPRVAIQASTVIAVFFAFAAIMIITTSACIIFYHRRQRQPSGISKAVPGWGRTMADADSQSGLIDSRTKDAQQHLGTKQVPMLQPMAFLQGREGPKEFVTGRGKRRSSALPRLIVDGMGGIWPRRHSVWTVNSNYVASEDGTEQGGTPSRRVSKRSHRSRPSSKVTIGRKNGSNLSASSTKPTTTVQMERTIPKQPSTTFTEPPPSLSTSPSSFPDPRQLRNTSASTDGPPSSYKKSKLRRHHQGDSFLDDDIREDEIQTSYISSAGSVASSSMLDPVNLAVLPVPPLPTHSFRNQVNNH